MRKAPLRANLIDECLRRPNLSRTERHWPVAECLTVRLRVNMREFVNQACTRPEGS